MSRVQQTTLETRQAGYQHHSLPALLLTAYCLLLVTGCVRRTLTIRSMPAGAELLVNDKRLGTTPYSYDFTWYGWYRLTLTKPGYERFDDRPLIEAPFYLWIPLDLIMELLPFTVSDAKTLSYTLTPKTPLPELSPPILTPSQSPSSEQPPAAATTPETGSSPPTKTQAE